MNKLSLSLSIAAALLVGACQSAPPPEPMPSPEPEAAAAPQEPAPIGTVRVNASALNVRSEPSMDGEILTQVKRGESLPLLETGDGWMRVKLPDGQSGWASARFLLKDGEKANRHRRRGACLPDSDFALATAPTPTFSDSGQHGEVVVEALVDVNGNVKSTTVIRNTTGDEALAFLTEKEIKSATFIAPVRDCAPREFIYTYKRAF